MRNTGKGSEGLVDVEFTRAGAFVYRFKDAAHLHGMNRGPVRSPPMPSDFHVTHGEHAFYAEVKSTADPDRFSFSLLQPEQRKTGIKVTRAGGLYYVFVHRLDADVWYRVPYELIRDCDAVGVKSLRWDILDEHELRWSFPS